MVRLAPLGAAGLFGLLNFACGDGSDSGRAQIDAGESGQDQIVFADAGGGAFGDCDVGIAASVGGGAEHPAGICRLVAELGEIELAGAGSVQRGQNGQQIDGQHGRGRPELFCHAAPLDHAHSPMRSAGSAQQQYCRA
ncbi:hypothetical protein N8D56_00790 [Devosia sp. A8/3-2]|nr:hypothetical protein N8D56_00790 [Devosia sp. A8/3-2]